MDYLKEFISKLEHLAKMKRTSEVFRDFLTLSTCTLTRPFLHSDSIEQKYLDTINQYSKEQAEEFPKLLALLISALEQKFQDFLGYVYMNLKMGNSATGQFFTPYDVSKLMAQINFNGVEEHLKRDEFITLSEPCCGSAGMIIAFAETMKEKNYNYQKQLFAEAIDVDETCFMMAFIQLSLYGIPARVVHGDTLTLKTYQVLYTPLYYINGIYTKLNLYRMNER